jgi:hypothetical protein
VHRVEIGRKHLVGRGVDFQAERHHGHHEHVHVDQRPLAHDVQSHEDRTAPPRGERPARPHTRRTAVKQFANRNEWDFGWKMNSRGRFATPADSPRHDCSPYSHVHVRRESLGFLHRSGTSFCRPVPNPKCHRFAAFSPLYGSGLVPSGGGTPAVPNHDHLDVRPSAGEGADQNDQEVGTGRPHVAQRTAQREDEQVVHVELISSQQ